MHMKISPNGIVQYFVLISVYNGEKTISCEEHVFNNKGYFTFVVIFLNGT